MDRRLIAQVLLVRPLRDAQLVLRNPELCVEHHSRGPSHRVLTVRIYVAGKEEPSSQGTSSESDPAVADGNRDKGAGSFPSENGAGKVLRLDSYGNILGSAAENGGGLNGSGSSEIQPFR